MTPQRKLAGPETCDVRPSDIPTAHQHFWDAFDHTHTEISAKWIVRFCTENGDSWAPFTREALQTFYQDQRGKPGKFFFNRLIKAGAAWSRGERVWRGGGWVREIDGKLHVTEDFIRRCVRVAEGSPKLMLG